MLRYNNIEVVTLNCNERTVVITKFIPQVLNIFPIF